MRPISTLLVLSLLAACGHKTATGLYMLHDAGGLFTVQVVETDNDHLTGRAEFMGVGPDGQVTDNSDTVIGAVSGSGISLELKPEALLQPSRSLSGSIDDSSMTLDGTGATGHFHVVLQRTSQEAVQAAVASLNTQATELRQSLQAAKQSAADEKTLAAFAQQAVDVGVEDDTFSGKIDRDLKILLAVQEKFHQATISMRAKLAEERNTVGDYHANVRRSQLFVEANQIGIEANGAHIEFEQEVRAAQTKLDSLDRRTIDTAQGCHSAHQATPTTPVRPGLELWNADCLLLLQGVDKFDAAKNRLTEALATTESVWAHEKVEQDQISAEAQAATN